MFAAAKTGSIYCLSDVHKQVKVLFLELKKVLKKRSNNYCEIKKSIVGLQPLKTAVAKRGEVHKKAYLIGMEKGLKFFFKKN